jgi:hypothetical protein
MTITWMAIGFAGLANLVGWWFRPQPRLNMMTPVAFARWRQNHRRIGLPLAGVGTVSLLVALTSGPMIGSSAAILASLSLALAGRSLIGLVRAWAFTHDVAQGPRVVPRVIDLNLDPVNPLTRIGEGHQTLNGVPRTLAGSVFAAQQRYREQFADSISKTLGRRIDEMSLGLARFLLEGIGDEPGWQERLDLKIRMWLEPTLGSIRFDRDNLDEPLIWDLDESVEHDRIVLVRTDEAAACV